MCSIAVIDSAIKKRITKDIGGNQSHHGLRPGNVKGYITSLITVQAGLQKHTLIGEIIKRSILCNLGWIGMHRNKVTSWTLALTCIQLLTCTSDGSQCTFYGFQCVLQQVIGYGGNQTIGVYHHHHIHPACNIAYTTLHQISHIPPLWVTCHVGVNHLLNRTRSTLTFKERVHAKFHIVV